MKKFLIGLASVIGGILAIALLIGYLAIGLKFYTISIYKAPTSDKCYMQVNGKSYNIITLTTDDKFVLDRFYVDGQDSAMTRSVFDIGESTYGSHIVGSLYYLYRGGIIPFRLAKGDALPVKAVLKGLEYHNYNAANEAPFKNGNTYNDIIYISDTSIIIQGDHYTYTDSIPKDIQDIISRAEKEWSK